MISKIKIALCILFCGVGFFAYTGNSVDYKMKAVNEDRIRRVSERQKAGLPLLEGELNFEGADLSYLDLSGLVLDGINLSWADLSNTSLRGTRLRYANLHKVTMSGWELGHGTMNDEPGTSLHDADFTGAIMSGAVLEKVNFDNSTLTNVNFSCANLKYTILSGANIKGASFKEAVMLLAQMTHDQAIYVKLTGARDVLERKPLQ